MDRKDFIEGIGLLGIASVWPDPKTATAPQTPVTSPVLACSVGTTETDGPYPLYTSRGSAIARTNITDGKTGIPLILNINIINTNANCAFLQNARVDIWHCDKDGYYSGYSNSGYLGTQNNTTQVFCRGIQYTDSNGLASFTTIYPGWYTGRISHIHAQIYVDNTLKLTTQFAFPAAITTAVYNTSLYSAHGQNSSVTSFAGDNVFSDGTTNELLTVTGSATSGYVASITVGVAGPVVTTDPTTCTSMYTLRSGSWNDLSVWSCGRLPTRSDVVTIKDGHVIVLNVDGSVKSVVYQGGTLRFSENTRLVIAG